MYRYTVVQGESFYLAVLCGNILSGSSPAYRQDVCWAWVGNVNYPTCHNRCVFGTFSDSCCHLKKENQKENQLPWVCLCMWKCIDTFIRCVSQWSSTIKAAPVQQAVCHPVCLEYIANNSPYSIKPFSV